MLDKIKRRLGIVDDSQDALLEDLIDDAQSHFMVLTKADVVDPKFEFIIRDVVVSRYNRANAMGLQSESTPDYSVSYRDPAKDFEPYLGILNEEYHFLDGYRPGKVTFI